jgi:ABC-type sugar transport system substrate-binding protein
MKRAPALLSIALAAALGLGGCSMFHHTMPAPAAPAAPVAAASPAVETIPFHTGVSSATVEKMAKQQGCTGGQGAGLITQPGPVEVYRMRCESGTMSGKVFMARCELRQCRRM